MRFHHMVPHDVLPEGRAARSANGELVAEARFVLKMGRAEVEAIEGPVGAKERGQAAGVNVGAIEVAHRRTRAAHSTLFDVRVPASVERV